MFFNPGAVAIIGASRAPDKIGHAVLHNVVTHGFRGAIYPINPKADEIMGLCCYPNVRAVPGPVDLALIVVPSKHVIDALVDCGEKGVKGVIVISAGFRETGGEGWQRERELGDIARSYGMRLLGPNCLGIIDTLSDLNASFAVGMPQRGSIAFMSQSGALCTSVLDMALNEKVGFTHFVSLGNKADLDELALTQAWGQDPDTDVIMGYLEGIDDGVEFMRIAREVSCHKPIILVKAGSTSAGSRAVSSHTGTLAGAERSYEAAFAQSGIIRAGSLQELFDYSIAFARQPLLRIDRIAIVTNAGGPGIMATDACERTGLQLASIASEVMDFMRQALPPAASVLNPVDVLGDAPAERYALALEAVASDPNVGGVLAILTPQMMTEVDATARVIGKLARRCDKPVLASFMGSQQVASGVRILNEFRVPNYPVPERAVAALAAMMRHRRWRERPPIEVETFDVDQERVRAILDAARAEGQITVSDGEALDVLAAYGLATPRTELARTPDEAVRCADKIGFPVALKIVSPDIQHRTDVGGVQLNLTSPAEVRDAYEMMVYRAGHHLPGVDIWGCLVQKMVFGGKEVLAAMYHDPHFGPLMVFGSGGIYVEALQDTAIRIVPFGRREAREMISETRATHLLRGVPGERPSDVNALLDALLRLAQLVTDFPEIVEFELNPLTVMEEDGGVVGIDMRLILE